MARDGSGTYTLPEAAFVAGTTIESAKVNSNNSDIASALTASIAKDGQTTPTANLPMGGFKHTNVATSSSRTDYLRTDQVYGSVEYAADTGSATAFAIAPSPGISAYAVGQSFRWKPANANSGTTPTLAVNGLTAGTIVWPDGSAVAAGDIPAGAQIETKLASLSGSTPTWHLATVAVPPIRKSLTTTRGDIIRGGVGGVPERLALGTSGYFLKSDGTDAVWASIAASGATVRQQSFTSSGTYTPHANMVTCVIEACGGGGGGGGCATTNASVGAGAGGGGAGSRSRKFATAADIGASQTVTIGAAGSAGSAGNNAGGNGGDTSVGTLCIGKGGSGGAGNAGGAGANVSAGGAGGVAGTGDDTPTGQPGGGGGASGGSNGPAISGAGGSSPYGGGGRSAWTQTATAGEAATGKGAGGAGAAVFNGGGDTAGGAGTAGKVVIWEFCSS